MTFSSQMDDAINLLLLHQLVEGIEVADVHLNKLVVGFVLDVLQVCEVTCIRQLVKVDDFVLWVLVCKETYNMRADKARTASNYNITLHFVCCFKLLMHFSSESTQ